MTIATRENPLRPSKLPLLTLCELSGIFTERTGTNAAADTGSAVHKAIELFHTDTQGDATVAIALMRDFVDKYPLADLDEATKQFRLYAKDPENQATPYAVEQEVSFELPPSKEDKTGQPVCVRGTLDQIRMRKHGPIVWDVKTSNYPGFQLIHSYAMQLAAYQMAASVLLDTQVCCAGIIRTKDYYKKKDGSQTGPVFWEAPWTFKQALRLMNSLRHTVARIRNGEAHPNPGGHCQFCVGGVSVCEPEAPVTLLELPKPLQGALHAEETQAQRS